MIEDGVVVELDGRSREDWDVLDHFLARYGLDLEVAAEAAALDDVGDRAAGSSTSTSPRAELVRLSRGLTPARLARVIAMLDPVELMFALKKLRARRAPANQAHVTNLKENPALLAADAAEAAARGFAELETTVGVSRYAPLNAIAILVGSQTGRPGVMTQCAVEERLNLRLAIQGLVTYAETLSVYGTEPVFVDGDDTPWSKAFLASAYASRGVKVRFTSGGGSEALMGESEGKSMLYLEARCLSLDPRRRLAGRAERLDLVRRARALGAGRHARGAGRERARRVARPRGRVRQRRDREPLGDPQDGEADGPVPARHRLRHVGLLVDAALRQHVRRRQLRLARLRRVADDAARLAGRRGDRAARRGGRARGARARRARGAGRLRRARLSRRSPTRRCASPRRASTRATCPTATARRTCSPATACWPRGSAGSTSPARSTRRGFADVGRGGLRHAAPARVGRLPADLGGDRARTARRARRSTTPNHYTGPGTGYRLEGERWERLRRLPHAVDARLLGGRAPGRRRGLSELGPAQAGDARRRGRDRRRAGVRRRARRDDQRPRATHDVLARASSTASARRAATPRIVRVRRSADVAFIGHDGALPVGLGRRGRPAVEGHGADPPRRPAAARQPRAVRDGAVADARLVPPDRRNAAGLRARPPGRAGADGARQLRAREADRPHDAAARPRGGRGRAAARPRSSSCSSRRPRRSRRRSASSQGLPSRPQRCASWPSTITHVCSRSSGASSVSSSVSVSRSISVDSSSGVSRRSNSSTRTSGIASFSTCCRAAVGAEHEIELPVGDVVERHGRERLHERDAVLGVAACGAARG